MSKLVVYLDQNFASNLAKSAKLDYWKDPDKDLYCRMLDVLKKRTREDKLICPTSYFHREESERSPRIKRFFWHVVEELSFDLCLKPSAQISWDQIRDAARAYCGLKRPEVSRWTMFFNRDPMVSVRDMNWPPKVQVHIPTPEEFLQFDKYLTKKAGDQYSEYKKTRFEKSQTFLEELSYQKRQLVLESFLPPEWLVANFLPNQSALGLIAAAEMRKNQQSVFDILETSPNPLGFYQSSELMEIPFLHVRASLMAADVFYTPKAKPEYSLSTDLDMAASVLPCVDVLATDGHMMETIRRAKLDKQFHKRVFSMRQRSEFLKFIECL